jgi:hypothetical protein
MTSVVAVTRDRMLLRLERMKRTLLEPSYEQILKEEFAWILEVDQSA